MLKPLVLYRIAAAILVLFTAGHTFGFLRFQAPSPEARSVWEGMNKIRFTVGGSTFSYGGFYVGFGLFVSAYLLFSAYLSWSLGSLSVSVPRALPPVAWGFFAVQIASLILSWMYFSAPPAVLSGLVAACTGAAAWLLTTAHA
jgi:hypothetical protein